MSKQCEFSEKCEGFSVLSSVCMDEAHRIRLPDEDIYCGLYRLFLEKKEEKENKCKKFKFPINF